VPNLLYLQPENINLLAQRIVDKLW
jgi:hypothetical protein